MVEVRDGEELGRSFCSPYCRGGVLGRDGRDGRGGCGGYSSSVVVVVVVARARWGPVRARCDWNGGIVAGAGMRMGMGGGVGVCVDEEAEGEEGEGEEEVEGGAAGEEWGRWCLCWVHFGWFVCSRI